MAEEKPLEKPTSESAPTMTAQEFLEKVTPGADGGAGGEKAMRFSGDQFAQIILVPKGTEYPMPDVSGGGSHMAGEQMMSEQEQSLSKIKELETQLSDSTKKVSEVETSNAKLSEENKKLAEENKKLSEELAAIRQAEVDGLVGQIVDIRLAKGLTDADKAEETKVTLKQLPAEHLKILLADLSKIVDKIPVIQKPKATDVQLSANDEEKMRMELFGHKERF